MRIEDICNAALDGAGYKRHIGHILEGSIASRVALDLWGEVRDAVLSATPWEFARGQQTLTLLTDSPLIWAYRYPYPAGMLVLLSVWPASQPFDPRPTRFQEYYAGTERFILASITDAVATGTFRVTTTAIWPPTFVEAMIHELTGRFREAFTDGAVGRSKQRPGSGQAATDS